MKRVVLAVVVAALAIIGAVIGDNYLDAARATPLAISTVKVKVQDGHGSGVYIGDGLVLTAAHVVGDESQVQVQAQNGHEISAVVLWVSKGNDVALLSLYGPIEVERSSVRCSATAIGESVVAYGNPLNVEFARSRGTVATGPITMKEVEGTMVALDATIVMGMSGGPVFDTAGKVVGLIRAVQMAPMGFSASLTRFGFMIPSTTICKLFAR